MQITHPQFSRTYSKGGPVTMKAAAKSSQPIHQFSVAVVSTYPHLIAQQGYHL